MRKLPGIASTVVVAMMIITGAGAAARSGTDDVVAPGEFFGFRPGDDRMLFDYDELIEYLKLLDAGSPMIELREIGVSPLGRKIYIAFISSEENIRRLDALREINRSLALEASLAPGELESHVEEGKVFFLATLSMHSTEVGPSQAAPLIAHRLVSGTDSKAASWLDDVVYMMVPCHNPDGMDMVVEHYRKYKGTKYESSRMPGIYHRYVGHDNNRDFVALTQSDTRAVSSIYSTEWFPQVMVEKHQMGSSGVRYFVPPNHDPIAENVDARLWNWIGIFGSNMIKDMTGEGLAGIAQHYLFDEYWPGSTGTCSWKNVITFLTEAASAHYAKPVFVERSELSVYGKGLAEHKKSVNMPLPWEGGWWRLSDIVDYEISSTLSVIKTASRHRADILALRNELCRSEVEKGRSTPPYYYVLPSGRQRQDDLSELGDLVALLAEHGVEVFTAGDDTVLSDGLIIEEGDVVVPLAQPFRAFVKEVMESQEFPLRHYTPDGEIIKPYDITSWSLPLHRGLACHQVMTREKDLESGLVPIDSRYTAPVREADHDALLLDPRDNGSFRAVFGLLAEGYEVSRYGKAIITADGEVPAGAFIVSGGRRDRIPTEGLYGRFASPVVLEEGTLAGLDKERLSELKVPAIAVVETYYHDMDAGWTRFVLDSYGIPFETLRPHEIAERDIADDFEVLIFPDTDPSVLMTGKRKRGDDYAPSTLPPGFARGMEKEGKDKLVSFIDGGGTVISWGRSCGLFEGALQTGEGKDDKEEFSLPFSDISDRLARKGLYVPGSLIRVELSGGHPLTFGMGEEAGVFTRGRPVFATSIPSLDMDRRVIALIAEKDILLSGYAEELDTAGGEALMVWMRKNRGQLVVFGFNPQFRASTQGTYKLLMNAILLPPPDQGDLK